MTVDIRKCPTEDDWKLCKDLALETVWKESGVPPDTDWKHDILEARHSPIRALIFVFRLKGIPYYVSTHLVRHVHATPFVSSQRNDRQNMYDRTKAPQNAPVNMSWLMNAEELMSIANKRLCMKASKETRDVVQSICDLVIERFPEFNGLLVPMCEYHGGVCHEMNPCGRLINAY